MRREMAESNKGHSMSLGNILILGSVALSLGFYLISRFLDWWVGREADLRQQQKERG